MSFTSTVSEWATKAGTSINTAAQAISAKVAEVTPHVQQAAGRGWQIIQSGVAAHPVPAIILTITPIVALSTTVKGATYWLFEKFSCCFKNEDGELSDRAIQVLNIASWATYGIGLIGLSALLFKVAAVSIPVFAGCIAVGIVGGVALLLLTRKGIQTCKEIREEAAKKKSEQVEENSSVEEFSTLGTSSSESTVPSKDATEE